MSCSNADVGPDAARLEEQTATEPALVKKGETKRGGNIQAHHHHHQHPALQGEDSLHLHCMAMYTVQQDFIYFSLLCNPIERQPTYWAIICALSAVLNGARFKDLRV